MVNFTAQPGNVVNEGDEVPVCQVPWVFIAPTAELSSDT